MKVKYDTGVIGSENADSREAQLKIATRQSKLPITWQRVYEKGAWCFYAETKYDVFNSWDEFCDYITALVVKYNKEH